MVTYGSWAKSKQMLDKYRVTEARQQRATKLPGLVLQWSRSGHAIALFEKAVPLWQAYRLGTAAV